MNTDPYASLLTTAIGDLIRFLDKFASDRLFAEQMADIFGTDAFVGDLQQSWRSGEVNLPPILVRPAAVLGNAWGGFALATETIYLAEELFLQPLSKIVAVLLEEYGHFVDAHLNLEDTPGDEGALFSAMVLGRDLSESEINVLRTKEDWVTLVIDGQEVVLQQAHFEGTSGDDVINLGSGSDIDDGHTVDGKEGNDTLTLVVQKSQRV